MTECSHYKILLELPLATKNFGGVVGNKVTVKEGVGGLSRLVIQLAYLEKGQGARVRYLEHETPVILSSGGAGRLEGFREISSGDNAILELDIICE